MQYSIETSADGKIWHKAFDASKNTQGGTRKDTLSATGIRFLKLNILGQKSNLWPSLWELSLYGQDGKKLPLFPRVEQQKAASSSSRLKPPLKRTPTKNQETTNPTLIA